MRTLALAAVAALGLALTTSAANAGDPYYGHRHRGPVYPVAPAPYGYAPARVVPHCDHYHVVPDYRPVPAPVYYRPVAPVVPVYPRPYGGSGFSFSLNFAR
jgi:hypothetical protein